ncbi:MAG: DUF2007 domain-containing protein [Acidimicrobiia bacterium]|nr:DUF2007 domain-containing protein [Acidimicrobiia bacterium]NNC75281.1 DUF2007 domain-containing protein [Acidimicrobiia bacterium]
MDPHPAHFVRLASIGSLPAAEILAARLRSEGIEVRVHSQAFGPYPVTVGQMAETELWVLDDRLDDASEILLDAEVNEVLERDETTTTSMPWQFRFGALGVVAVFAVLWILRLIRVYP